MLRGRGSIRDRYDIPVSIEDMARLETQGHVTDIKFCRGMGQTVVESSEETAVQVTAV